MSEGYAILFIRQRNRQERDGHNMKKRGFVLLAILTLLLTGCGNDDTTVFDKVNTIDGVTLTLKEDTLKASKATFVLKNDSDRDVRLSRGQLLHTYHLETKKGDVWKENIGTRVSQWKRDETETLPAGESLETTVEWKGLCGTIGKGEHRIILIVDEQPIACEFEKN